MLTLPAGVRCSRMMWSDGRKRWRLVNTQGGDGVVKAASVLVGGWAD